MLRRILKVFRPFTIRKRLLTAFLLILLIPAVAFGIVSVLFGVRNGHEQVKDQLTSVAVLKEAEIEIWVKSIRSDLLTVIIEDETTDHMCGLLSINEELVDTSLHYTYLFDRFNTLLIATQRFDQLFLVNLDHQVVLSTQHKNEESTISVGGSLGSQAFQILEEGLRGENLNLIALTQLYKDFVVIAVRPVLNRSGELCGLLVGHASSAKLSEIMLERAGLGETGETYLVNQNGIMLTTSRYQAGLDDALYSVLSAGPKVALYNHQNGSGIYQNYHHESVIGVYHWLPELDAVLVAEQSEREAMASVYQMVFVILGVALAAALLASAIGVSLARSILLPLDSLAQTAIRITQGEYNLAAPIEREDEIGTLARAFNTMTARLQELINSLDQRVRNRTQMLRQRALQLETSAQVGREITSILAMEELLNRVVNLIAEAFGYYHVGIYLVDPDTNKLDFQTGGGEVAGPDPIRNRSLEIGPGSLNGEAAARNEAIVVNDTTQNQSFLADELLQETRSELIVPLRIGKRVIGTLDIQSSKVDNFSADDARIIQGLGDQVAVAIENARLYTQIRTLAVMEERNRLARELHDAVTQSLYGLVAFAGGGRELIRTGNWKAIEDQFNRIEQVAQQALKEMRLLLFELRPPILAQEGLAGALRERLEMVEKRAGIATQLFVDEKILLTPEIERGFYRIAQEALNNALNHACAAAVAVTLRQDEEWIELQINDDGIGFDADRVLAAPGLGLTGMRERAVKMGGFLTIESAPGEGTSIRLRVRNILIYTV